MGPSDDAPDPFGRDGVCVAVQDVHVRYRVRSSAQQSQASVPRLLRPARRLLGRQQVVQVRAVAGVSLVARAGEQIGIIGLNGSGKSAFLRVVAGLERPARGEVWAKSPPVLLGVSAALLPELSGMQNVVLGCLAMGMTRDEARAAVPGIIALADIGDSLHLPMKTYSSGMGARLRFAIAMAARPEILLIDEALATGDAAFRERSQERVDEFRRSAGTVFLVSHAAKTVEEECTRAVWLHRGHLVMDGPAEPVARRYRWWAWNLAKGETEVAARLLDEAFRLGHDTVVDLDLDVDVLRRGVAAGGPRHARDRRAAQPVAAPGRTR